MERTSAVSGSDKVIYISGYSNYRSLNQHVASLPKFILLELPTARDGKAIANTGITEPEDVDWDFVMTEDGPDPVLQLTVRGTSGRSPLYVWFQKCCGNLAIFPVFQSNHCRLGHARMLRQTLLDFQRVYVFTTCGTEAPLVSK
jgi:hypothetical protein